MTQRTRVVFVINDLARAGAETQLAQLALALDRAAYEVSVVLLKERNDFATELAEAGIPVTPLRRRGWWDLLVVWRLYRHLRRARPGVVHSQLFLANLLTVVAGRAARVPSLVLSQRCSYEATLTPFWRRVARWSHRRADRVIVNSLAAYDEEIAAGFPAQRLVHIANGVRLAPGPAVSRDALGLPRGPLALTLGQFDAIKGHHVLLDAWPAVLRAVSEARLVLLGDGPRRAHLEAQARRLGISESVRFLGFRAHAAPYLCVCDVVVQPSLSEGMPNAVLEAMAMGRPVVASRVGGIPELVEDGETGLLVPPDDPGALGEALVRLLVNPPQGAAFGAAGQRRAKDRFSVELTTARTSVLYREVTARVP